VPVPWAYEEKAHPVAQSQQSVMTTACAEPVATAKHTAANAATTLFIIGLPEPFISAAIS
jgi:hypothetical protein